MRIISGREVKQSKVEAFNTLCDNISRRAREKGLTEEKLQALLYDDFDTPINVTRTSFNKRKNGDE